MGYFIQRGPARIDSYISLHAFGGREQIPQCLPKRRDRIHRPGDSRYENQYDGREDKQQHHILPPLHEPGKRHGEEYAGKQIGQQEQKNVQRTHKQMTA